MKNQSIKPILSTLLISLFLFFAYSSGESSESEKSTDSEIAEVDNDEDPHSEISEEESIEYKIGNKITEDVYESNENGLKTYLRFDGSEGSSGMFGSLTLSNNASNCKYVYTYDISDVNINATFFGSDCGNTSNNQTFSFNEESNTISCYINGQRFVFKSVF